MLLACKGLTDGYLTDSETYYLLKAGLEQVALDGDLQLRGQAQEHLVTVEPRLVGGPLPQQRADRVVELLADLVDLEPLGPADLVVSFQAVGVPLEGLDVGLLVADADLLLQEAEVSAGRPRPPAGDAAESHSAAAGRGGEGSTTRG